MSIEVSRYGRYRLFDTTQQYRILVLDESDFYVFREDPRGVFLELSDPGHEMAYFIHEGHYLCFLPTEETDLQNRPCLALQDTEGYQLYYLPEGLPIEGDELKPIESCGSVTHDRLGHLSKAY